MATLWFSYSLPGGSLDVGEPISSPYSISWYVGRMLREKATLYDYAFRYINLDSIDPVEFGPDDIAIGHLWDTPDSFMQQALNANIRAKIILQPYSHGMVSTGDISRYVDMFSKADALLFITGEYWFSTMLQSPFASLKSRATRLDMAVNTALHPHAKTRWNKSGERAVCVIGHDTPTKGYKFVAELARVAGFRLGHFGSSDGTSFAHVPCMVMHGGVLFTPETIVRVCQEYDAIIALPEADANPTVLLEAASWGLTVFASREAGYLPNRPFLELRKDHLQFNVAQIRAFQRADEYTLKRDSLMLRQTVEREYSWSKFCDAVWQKVSAYL